MSPDNGTGLAKIFMGFVGSVFSFAGNILGTTETVNNISENANYLPEPSMMEISKSLTQCNKLIIQDTKGSLRQFKVQTSNKGITTLIETDVTDRTLLWVGGSIFILGNACASHNPQKDFIPKLARLLGIGTIIAYFVIKPTTI